MCACEQISNVLDMERFLFGPRYRIPLWISSETISMLCMREAFRCPIFSNHLSAGHFRPFSGFFRLLPEWQSRPWRLDGWHASRAYRFAYMLFLWKRWFTDRVLCLEAAMTLSITHPGDCCLCLAYIDGQLPLQTVLQYNRRQTVTV